MIGLSLALLAIVAGMFLLAKTRAEALGKFFKFVSYTVIVAGFLCLICCIMHCCCMMGCSSGSSCMQQEQCMSHAGQGNAHCSGEMKHMK